MAWPQCGRILGRNLGGRAAVCDISSAGINGGKIWELAAAAKSIPVERDPISPADGFRTDSLSSDRKSQRLASYGRATWQFRSVRHGRPRITTAAAAGGSSSSATQQALGTKLFHSSPAESKAAGAAAPAAEVSGLHIEDVQVAQADTQAAELSFDGEVLYSGMTSKELLVTLGNLQMLSYDPVVDLSLKVLNSRLIRWPVTSAPLLWMIKRTTYKHFCAGEDTVEAGQTLKRLWELGLRGVLDYSLEDAEDEVSCDENCQGFLKTIASTEEMPPGSVSFICVKISAICPIGLLERVSDHLRWQLKNPEYKLPWSQDSLPVLARESPTYQTMTTPKPLSTEEEAAFLRAQQRLRLLCQSCAEKDLPILLDAEYTTIQPAIDYMTYVSLFEFNTGGRPVVYLTMQAYMKDAPSRLSGAIAETAKRNAFLGLKLVRGAYIVRESALAASLGFPSPIHDSLIDTHNCYHRCASMILDRVPAGNSAIVLATHNANSGRFALQKVNELGLGNADPRVQFAQLKGMADSLSLALVNAGFNVSKYLPFGPVERVIPYLVRRAHENRGMLSNTLPDLQRMRKELGRRTRRAVGLKQFF